MNPHHSVDDGKGGRASFGSPAGPRPVASRQPAAATESRACRRWSSRQLLGDEYEIEIAHADSIYRLRITSLGKLILTK